MKYIFIILTLSILSGCSKKYPYESVAREYLHENLESFNELNERLVGNNQFHQYCMHKNLGSHPSKEDVLFASGMESRYVDLLPPGACYVSNDNYLLVDPLTEEACFNVSCNVSFIYTRKKTDIRTCELQEFKSFRGECVVLVGGGWGILYSVPKI